MYENLSKSKTSLNVGSSFLLLMPERSSLEFVEDTESPLMSLTPELELWLFGTFEHPDPVSRSRFLEVLSIGFSITDHQTSSTSEMIISKLLVNEYKSSSSYIKKSIKFKIVFLWSFSITVFTYTNWNWFHPCQTIHNIGG